MRTRLNPGGPRLAALTAALLVLLAASTLLAIGLGSAVVPPADTPVALAATAVMGFSHAVVGATVTSLVAHRAGPLTTTTFSLQAAGMSLGVFAGAALRGAGLALAGDVGLAAALAVPTALAAVLVRPATVADP
ncbi:hypothetical protein GCM10027063_17860 [Promicromonospora xylanilytica]